MSNVLAILRCLGFYADVGIIIINIKMNKQQRKPSIRGLHSVWICLSIAQILLLTSEISIKSYCWEYPDQHFECLQPTSLYGVDTRGTRFQIKQSCFFYMDFQLTVLDTPGSLDTSDHITDQTNPSGTF